MSIEPALCHPHKNKHRYCTSPHWTSLFLIITFFLSACNLNPPIEIVNPLEMMPTITPTPFQPEGYTPPTSTVLPADEGSSPTEPPPPESIWISEAVPETLRTAALDSGLSLQGSPEMADVVVDVQSTTNAGTLASLWIYALVAPFPTITDEVSLDDLRRSWAGEVTGPFAGLPLFMEQATLEAISALWGAPAEGKVRVEAAETLADRAWENTPCWGIVPFEALEPRWKVLRIDGQSPITKDFAPATYPLIVPFSSTPPGLSLPETNRDPAKMTVLVMTGVTALVRATAYRMEKNGITYPAQDIAPWLQDADITHISNEVSFAVDCPVPDPYSMSLTFCSSPDYMELLHYISADVIELTGNHMNDWGGDSFLYSLELYQQNNLPTFGGGADSTAATTPLILTHNGNTLAFIGCNAVGPGYDWADADSPGSARCGDYAWMAEAVGRLRAEGALPVVTFQYNEYYTSYPPSNQRRDFAMMADAGAAIVSGSQSHFPMGMAFDNETFIHYGLGNLFFDQMFYTLADGTVITGTQREFIDRYVIYENRLVSVELLTAQLEDFAKPRPMTAVERAQMLEDIFTASGWR